MSRKETDKETDFSKEHTEPADTDAGKTDLEEKLESLLSSVEGVGKTQVILVTDKEKDAGGFYDSGTPKVTGVLIAAEGADNSVVVRNIQQAVMALFQIEAHKIRVMKMVTVKERNSY